MASSVTAFLEEVEQLIASDGSVSFEDYMNFWEQMLQTNRQRVDDFMIILVAKLILLDTGQYRSRTLKEFVLDIVSPAFNVAVLKASEDPDVDALKSTVLNTLMYVALYYHNRTPDQQLAVVINNFKRYLRTCQGPVYDFLVQWLEGFFNAEESFRAMWLVENCFRSTIVDSQYLVCSQTLVASSLIHFYLQDVLLKDERMAAVILETTSMFLAHPNTTQTEIMSLLHMIRHFLSICPNVPASVVSSMFSLIRKKYYIWPKPYSNVAKDVLQMLSIEKMCQGHHLRVRFLRQHPELLAKQRTGKERIVHIMLDRGASKVPAIKQLLQCFDDTTPISANELRASLINSAFETELQSRCDVARLSQLPEEELSSHLQSIVSVFDQALMMMEADAEEYKRRELARIQKDLEKLCQVSPSRTASRPTLPPLQFDIKYVDCDNCDPEIDVQSNAAIAFPRRASANAILQILSEHRAQSQPKRGKTKVRIAVVGNDSTIHNLCSSFASLSCTNGPLLELFDVRLFFVPVGLSNFADWLGRQDVWYGRTVTCLLECVGRLWPSIIPTPSPVNSLALTLLRNAEPVPPVVEAPTKKKGKKKSKKEKEKEKEKEREAAPGQLGSPGPGRGMPMPMMDMNMDNAIAELQRVMAFRRTAERATSAQMKKKGKGPPPGSSFNDIKRSTRLSAVVNSINLPNFTLRQELENYFREARNKVELRVFQCECWTDNSSRSDFVVPFFQAAELGYVADTRAMEENYDDPSLDPAYQAGVTAASRYKNMVLPVLFMEAQLTDLFGNDRQGPSYPVKTFFSLIMSNVPSIADERTRVANPCHDWLEVHYTEIDAKKRKCDGTIHATSVEISTAGQKFSILLDDQLYGPFHKIKVSRCANTKGKAVTLPIMTFNPLVEYEPAYNPFMEGI